MNPARSGPLTLGGCVVPGDGRGRVIGFPTANLACADADIPEDGVYVATALIGGTGSSPWGATVSIGTNPTFAGERARRVEVYVHDLDLDLYGRFMRVLLHERMRPTLRFDDVAALIAQTESDVRQSRRILAERILQR